MHDEKNEQIQLDIEGLHCSSCIPPLTKALKQIEGVQDVHIHPTTGEALLEVNASQKNLDAYVSTVQKLGYKATIRSIENEDHSSHHHDTNPYKLRLLVGLLSTIPLWMQMVADLFVLHFHLPLIAIVILATIVQFWPGASFYSSTYYSLKARSTNMDVLICIGTTAAYGYSLYLWYFDQGSAYYFETSATIITFVLLGRYLEMKTKKRAQSLLTSLLKGQPLQARVLKERVWVDIPIKELKLNDLFQVRPGEAVPADGEIVEGRSYVDESLLTGESRGVPKEVGKKVFCGTQNLDGFLIVKASEVGSQTTLARLYRLVEKAQHSRAPIQALADRGSEVFVPVVAGISLLTFLGWWIFSSAAVGLINAVAVLIIACPCALGMATPAVILAACAAGARAGIFTKNAEVFERAHQLKTLVFDKTGTLTQGKPTLIKATPQQNISEQELIDLAYALEAHSNHPLAEAFQQLQPQHLYQASNIHFHGGKGMEGMIEGETYYLGSLEWIREKGLKADSEQKADSTILCLASQKEIKGLFYLQDTLSPHAKETVSQLKRLNLQVIMLTGDRQEIAQKIAHEVGISQVVAEVFPEGKAEVITSLKKNAPPVGMVGDGVNDAPALALADVGIALGRGADLAIETADATLIKNDIRGVYDLLILSKKTMLKAKENLFFAFFYNTLGIPLAALGFIHPIWAGAAMALSSLSVVSNALTLSRWRSPSQKKLI